MNKKQILEHAYKYIMEVAERNEYNLQCIAIKKFFKIKKNFPVIEDYEVDYSVFSNKFKSFCTRDFVYKKDYFTTREMYLISPAHYLYYTYNVFKYFYHNQTILNFSKSNISVFYSGKLDFSNFDFVKNGHFSFSYQEFQKEKEKFSNGRALIIDIQDFFKNISTNLLVEKLKNSDKHNCKEIIENIDDFFKINKFRTLPQFHYSIASSVLSQFYLCNFTEQMNNILVKEKCKAIRFVDDMIISLPKYKKRKKMNEVLNELTYYLWKDKLNLNSSKTKFLEQREFKKMAPSLGESVFEDKKTNYLVDTMIKEKIEWLLENDGKKLKEFITKLTKCYSYYSVDLTLYHKYINQYIAIDGDHATKVINNLLYSKKWKELKKHILIELISKNSYIFFNPMQFTTFFLMIINHLETDIKVVKKALNDFIKIFNDKDNLSFRDGIITIQYLLQMQKSDSKLTKKLNIINRDYVNFLDEFYN